MKPEIIINQNDLSKKGIAEIDKHYLNQIKEGNANGLEVHLKAKYIKSAMDAIIKSTIDYAITEADKYGKEDSLYGAKFQVKNLGDTYDFEADQVYANLKAQLKEREALLKDAIKAAQKGGAVVDHDGEIVEAPPMKHAGGQTISVTFK